MWSIGRAQRAKRQMLDLAEGAQKHVTTEEKEKHGCLKDATEARRGKQVNNLSEEAFASVKR